jgi:hypothetical protein
MDAAPAETRPFYSRPRLLFGLAASLALLLSGFSLRVFVGALIIAFPVRLAYVLIRRRARRPLLSGWIFVIAAGLLFVAHAGSHARAVRRANAAAVRQGVVATGHDAKPRDRCVGLYLDWWDRDEPGPPGLTKAKFRLFVTRVCRRAALDGVLRSEGRIDGDALRPMWDATGAAMVREGLLP